MNLLRVCNTSFQQKYFPLFNFLLKRMSTVHVAYNFSVVIHQRELLRSSLSLLSTSSLFTADLCSGLGLANLHLKVYGEDDLGMCNLHSAHTRQLCCDQFLKQVTSCAVFSEVPDKIDLIGQSHYF